MVTIFCEREKNKNKKIKNRRNRKHVISLSVLVRIKHFRNWLEKYSFSSLLPTRRISPLSFSFSFILHSHRLPWRLCYYSNPLFTIRQSLIISPTLLDPSRILPLNRDLDYLDRSPSDTPPQLLRSGNVLFLFGYNEKEPNMHAIRSVCLHFVLYFFFTPFVSS